MSSLSKYMHPRDEIMQTMERIYRYRMTTTSGGNLSIREPDVLEAFGRLEVLESTSEALINSRLIGEVAPMSDEVIDDLKRAFASMLA
ncbi:MAG: L-fuculose-phosphate aldolase [Acidobacteriota bacterium]|nr:L-fuculose-phosphate aldolase [Acidobacteriota bacterium]